MEFQCWTALEHVNAANAEAQVKWWIRQAAFESINWNLIAGQLLSIPMLPMLRLRYSFLCTGAFLYVPYSFMLVSNKFCNFKFIALVAVHVRGKGGGGTGR
jgi:hypothetical protein